MRSSTEKTSCVAAIGGMSPTVRAQRVLLAAGIAAEVVGLSPSETRRGCAFGLRFACESAAAVREALRRARISPSEYLERKPYRDLS